MKAASISVGDSLAYLKNLAADSVDSLVTDLPAGISFMGKEWDGDKGGREHWIAWLTEVMRECYRVLKPGAHGLVWAIPRTSHWTATALENAGFEVRDVVTHLFGTGFPKSLDISKAIDKAAGAAREVVGVYKRPDGTHRNYDEWSGKMNDDLFDTSSKIITSPATDSAKQWSGWGTALKPASEHWILVRKPLGEKTVAANVLKHGVGGLNIDGCRVTTTDNLNGGAYSGDNRASKDGSIMKIRGEPGEYAQPSGRFPANLVLSHNDDCDATCSEGCAVAELDRQSGILKSGNLLPGHKQGRGTGNSIQTSGGIIQRSYGGDSGGASRFFYCAKASKKDRGEGNTHPTVKSTELMRYLCRLVTPAGGTVLDPFAGSGSTGVAAISEGFSFIGIEMNAEYAAIAKARVEHARAKA